ncbi:hypothetical protein CDD83_4163 [Cordyceps sp. RAO-2017]|nr:hypothetical protein CDD83_4163 [Cordyceps sp. RAO-2017]
MSFNSTSSLQQGARLADQFPSHWQASTADGNLTLHGFRRFKTTHLLNLRYLEAEIAEIDHHIYQVGLGLDIEPSTTDRLGLRYCKRDGTMPCTGKTVTRRLVKRLRRLLKDYDEAVMAFNTIMSMDTFALVDDEKLCSLRSDLTLNEMYKTRLVRIDQTPRTRQDPLQRSIHHLLRLLRFLRLSKASYADPEKASGAAPPWNTGQWSSQNTALIADVISRVCIAAVTAAFITAPLAVLSHETRKGVQMAIISTLVVAFASVVSVTLRASNLEMMVVSAAYAAIISVFVSNGQQSSQQPV